MPKLLVTYGTLHKLLGNDPMVAVNKVSVVTFHLQDVVHTVRIAM
jgi:hypothetical protein